ncbi:sensor histidine kinase [Clostridium tunisiense]|uniref:sensor histidine kinase n=1 Tax=Clostridium tunisiense TaxID=219748 RepID=UPI000300F57C|nr:HAMP domain-containing sensor histidine kinase [Clostridium tunisiense]
MFKELRNKFLILNLVIISVMMVIAFSTIYLITYNNVKRDINLELHKISDINKKQKDNMKEPIPNFNAMTPPQDRSLSFTLITDNDGKTVSLLSIFHMEEDFYEKAKEKALSFNSDNGRFKLDDNHWAFVKISYMNGHRIVFLDITRQQSILTNLILTFLAVALLMLVAIFFISRFFANKSIAPIKEAFEKQKQFIGDASHELKTPLAVINTNVDVLLSNGEDSINSQKKWLNYIKSEVERMSKLTNDLLYLTQIDYSDVKMIFSNFNLSETIENVILTMEAVIFENNILFDYDLEEGLTIHGNNEQIKQVVMILLDNAVKYTEPKGTINLSLKKINSNATLSITNTGKGISEDHLSRIFDRFYRIDKSRERKSGGYGLGLSIAKAIVEHHGGKIYARSVVNHSTTFIVELPSL